MVPFLSALIMVRKLSFLGGISGMPVVVDRTRRNTGWLGLADFAEIFSLKRSLNGAAEY